MYVAATVIDIWIELNYISILKLQEAFLWHEKRSISIHQGDRLNKRK